ncbi:MAG TPA: tRNA (guanosine(46)-N7)-methyltransferase TrmB, partial [Usitatibacter sp.]|nr:tRNA (guanosine(46)-N7)-methyltransferase TrmB [Usitatibacter sp.]
MNHPPIRSYVLRQGRFSPAQQRAYAELMPRLGVPYAVRPLDFAALFGRHAPVVVEVGSGMGETTARIAAENPDTDYLAIEVHAPGVGSLLRRVAEEGLANVRVIQHDAVEVLRDMIPEGSLAGIHVFFPDPWPKKRHHKRRLLQPAFAALAASRLAPGGRLHVATDWQEYAEHVLGVLCATRGL